MKHPFEIYNPAYQLLLSRYNKMIIAIGYKHKGKMHQVMVKEFLCYLENKGILNIKKIQAVDMVAYYEYLIARPNLKTEGVLNSSSINNHMRSIRLLFDYLLNEKIIDRSITLPKQTREDSKQREILSIEEIQTLYKTCETKRDKAIISIAYGAGVRRTEIENLHVSDVQLSIGILIVRDGKNNKRREIPLSDAIISDLKDYLINERHTYFNDKNTPRTESFLVNNKGEQMKGHPANERLKELVKKTNDQKIIEKQISLHSLRHSIATHLLDNGASIEFVRKFLGHSEIDTVHIYSRRRKAKQQLQKKLQNN